MTGPGGGHRRPARPQFGVTWILLFVPLVLISVAWSLAVPLRAAPDESAHIVRAAAIVRGEWVGRGAGPDRSPAETSVSVPATFVLGGHLCYLFKVAVPAGCQPAVAASGVETPTVTYVGHYPPLFYLAVGWTSLLTSSTAAIYLMRAMSGILCAALVALAIASARRWSRSRLLAPAVAVAASPTATFIGSTVNPSGLEIASAICAWTAATILVVDHPRDPDRGLLVVAAGSMMTLLLVRGLSPLWAALVAVLLVPLAWRRLDPAALLRRRDVQVCVAGLGVASVLALAWIVLGRALTEVALAVPPRTTSDATLAERIVGQTGGLLHQAIGSFGYDTPAPYLTVAAWGGMVAGLVAVAAVLGERRAWISLSAAVLASVLVPAVLSYVSVRHVGPIAQGRYFMPLYAGVPIIAGAVIGDRALEEPALRRLLHLLWGAAAVGQVAAFYWSLRRFAVGFFGPLWPDAHVAGGWAPPLRPLLLDGVVVLLAAAFCVVGGRGGHVAPANLLELGPGDLNLPRGSRAAAATDRSPAAGRTGPRR